MTGFSGKTGRAIRSSVVVALLSLSGAIVALPASAAAPQLSQEQEWSAHPPLTAAVKAMDKAVEDLDHAAENYGGNKAAAIRDLKAALHSLKKAILYRLKLDDAAIDAAQAPAKGSKSK